MFTSVAPIETAEQKKNRDDLWLLLLLMLDDEEPQHLWSEYVPPAFAGLLTGDGFTWDQQTQTYKSDSGTTVNANAVQRIALSATHALEIDIERKLASAGQNETALEAWADSSIDDLLAMYLAAAAAGVGGVDNIDDPAIEAAYKAAARMRESIEGILDDLRAGRISQAQAVNRAGMNAQQTNGVFQDARRASHMAAADENGEAIFTQEQNVLTENAMHCGECPELTAQGWVDIGTLPLPGERECKSNCKCHLVFRRNPEQ